MATGIIYILTNDAMSGIIKIGITTDLEQRMKTLDTTGVPMPFRCHYAVEVDGYEKKEKHIHDGFSDHRIRPNREFFKLSPERAVSILKMLDGREIVSNNAMIGETGEIEENEKIEKEIRRDKFTFSSADVPIGAEIIFTRDETKKCVVASDQQVEYEGRRYSISPIALRFLKEAGYNWKSAQGAAFFTYEGELLADRRDRVETENSECEIG
ncbi:MAG: GIY-YIG nuclease family protein [Alphaproteobacteria bacterium]|nr:GIY-YIG nuclease family protein [Alphaproteobacteria bacterium]